MSSIAALALTGTLLTPISASGGPDKVHVCAARWQAATADQRATMTYGDFMAICTKTEALAPPGATARCRDGAYSMSVAPLGRCAAHGGVARVF